MKTYRTARVAEVIREVASETILFELQDPRIKNVTVTRVEVSKDLQHAKVFVSVMGSEREQDLCMHGLRHSAGFIQSRLAPRMKTRYTPVLKFVLDQGVKKSIEVTRLINEALALSRPAEEESDSQETAGGGSEQASDELSTDAHQEDERGLGERTQDERTEEDEDT